MKKDSKLYDFDGVDVEDAIAKAIKTLNVSREMINIKVVCEEQKGLFGMSGAKLARIKVQIK